MNPVVLNQTGFAFIGERHGLNSSVIDRNKIVRFNIKQKAAPVMGQLLQ